MPVSNLNQVQCEEIILMAASKEEIWATGRRKSAVARVRMNPGTGKIKVNGQVIEEYFPSEAVRGFICQPLTVTDTGGNFDILANIRGGGIVGQAGACRPSRGSPARHNSGPG